LGLAGSTAIEVFWALTGLVKSVTKAKRLRIDLFIARKINKE